MGGGLVRFAEYKWDGGDQMFASARIYFKQRANYLPAVVMKTLPESFWLGAEFGNRARGQFFRVGMIGSAMAVQDCRCEVGVEQGQHLTRVARGMHFDLTGENSLPCGY